MNIDEPRRLRRRTARAPRHAPRHHQVLGRGGQAALFEHVSRIGTEVLGYVCLHLLVSPGLAFQDHCPAEAAGAGFVPEGRVEN